MHIYKVFKKVLSLLDKKQKKNFFLLTFLMLISGFLETVGISMFIPVVYVLIDDSAFTSNTILVEACRLLGINTQQQFLLVGLILLGLVYILKNVYLYFQTVVQNNYVYNNRARFFNRIYSLYLNKDYYYFVENASGNITRSIYYDVIYTFDVLLSFINIITECIISATILLFLLIVNWKVSLIAGIILFAELIVINKIIKPILFKNGKANTENVGIFFGNIIQSIENIKEIKVFNTEKYFIKKNEQYVEALSKTEKHYKTLSTIPKYMIESFTFASLAAILCIFVKSGTDIKKFIPILSAFAVAAVKLLPSLNKISSNLSNISYYIPNLNNLASVIHEAESDQVKGNTDANISNLHVLHCNNSIELRDISFKYEGSDKYIFNNLNLIFPVNKSVGIIGGSGEGKTTLVDLLTGLLTPNQGSVLCDGINIQENYSSWLSLIGYIPQNTILVNDTITSNVAFGVDPAEIDKDRVINALKDAQIYDFVSGMKDGLDTTIGDRGMKLSGGQRQRIGIARALYKNPKILIFDESTSALDNNTEKEVMAAVNALMSNKTIIIISHRLSTLEKCDIIYKVSDGKVFQEKNVL